MNKYLYATLPAIDVQELLTAIKPEDSYTAFDKTSHALATLLDQGYRWVRTDGDTAIFEKELHNQIPPKVRALLDEAENMFRAYADNDPGACLTAGSEEDTAVQMADRLMEVK